MSRGRPPAPLRPSRPPRPQSLGPVRPGRTSSAVAADDVPAQREFIRAAPLTRPQRPQAAVGAIALRPRVVTGADYRTGCVSRFRRRGQNEHASSAPLRNLRVATGMGSTSRVGGPLLAPARGPGSAHPLKTRHRRTMQAPSVASDKSHPARNGRGTPSVAVQRPLHPPRPTTRKRRYRSMRRYLPTRH